MDEQGVIVVTEGNIVPEKTLNLTCILGRRVLSKSGIKVGLVSQIRLNANSTSVEGIIVTQGLWRKKIFIGKSYIERLTNEAVILTIDPAIFLRGKKVRTNEGEIVGTVREVIRKGNTNTVEQLIASSLLRGKFSIPPDAIRSGGDAIILKANYDVPKKHFFQRSG